MTITFRGCGDRPSTDAELNSAQFVARMSQRVGAKRRPMTGSAISGTFSLRHSPDVASLIRAAGPLPHLRLLERTSRPALLRLLRDKPRISARWDSGIYSG